MPSVEQRLELLESQVFAASVSPSSGLPQADILPRDIEISVTASLEGAYVILSWAGWSPTVKGYEIWIERPDGQTELAKTITHGPATLLVNTETEAPFIFRIRPLVGTGEEIALDRSPSIAATIPIAVIGSGDIADDSIQDRHLDHLSANRIVIVDADIVTLTANKLTAGTIDAAIISVVNLNASNINTGTLNAGVVNVTNINASNINAGTLNAGVVNVINIAAANILAGTITGVNILAGTYFLQVGNEIMQIAGANGFQQSNSGTGLQINLYNGIISVGNSGAEVARFAGDGNAEGGGLYQVDSGHLSIHNASETVKMRLGVISSGGVTYGRLEAIGSNSNSKATLDGGGGNAASLTLTDDSAATRVRLRATASAGELQINGTKVVGAQQADPGAGITLAQVRTILLNHGLIG